MFTFYLSMAAAVASLLVVSFNPLMGFSCLAIFVAAIVTSVVRDC